MIGNWVITGWSRWIHWWYGFLATRCQSILYPFTSSSLIWAVAAWAVAAKPLLPVDGLIDWLIDSLVGWLVGWMVGWLVVWLLGWLVGWLLHIMDYTVIQFYYVLLLKKRGMMLIHLSSESLLTRPDLCHQCHPTPSVTILSSLRRALSHTGLKRLAIGLETALLMDSPKAEPGMKLQ